MSGPRRRPSRVRPWQLAAAVVAVLLAGFEVVVAIRAIPRPAVWGPRRPAAGPAAGAPAADGDDALAAGFEGDWTLTRSVTSCDNVPEGCQSTPIQVRIAGCEGAACTIQRKDGGEFVYIAIQCKGRRNVGTIGMDFTVSGSTLTGTYTVSGQENPPDCDSNANAVYDLRGARS